MTNVLVTGANRGIGLGLTQRHLAAGDRVIACCRNPSEAAALKALQGDLKILALDVTSETSVAALKASVGDQPIDILYNNAGISGPHNQRLDDVDYDGWTKTFETNVQGPLRVALAFKDNLKAAKGKIVNISSGMGSIGTLTPGWLMIYAYRSSKTALNMVMRILSFELQKDGVTVILMSPGWVQTDMGGANAAITVEQSARGIISTIAKIGIEQSGCFINYDGKTIPW